MIDKAKKRPEIVDRMSKGEQRQWDGYATLIRIGQEGMDVLRNRQKARDKRKKERDVWDDRR